MQSVLPYIQILLAVLLTVGVLLQQSESGLGSAFGGSDSSIQYARRGFDKTLFRGTIVIAIAFVLSVFLTLFI
mgnify:CR=1 FL=1